MTTLTTTTNHDGIPRPPELSVTTHILMALAATLLSAGAVALAGCDLNFSGRSPGDTGRTHGPGTVLTSMGFSLTDDGDTATPAGDLDATFDAPVITIEQELTTAGTAHVAFDDETRDLAAAAVVGAFPENDVVYGVLFDESAPWRYVIIAAHAADLVDGADLALDGDVAAALVVDEETGSGYLSTSGSFHVDAANLALDGNVAAAGARLAGSVNAGLVEVSLATWPEALFPFRVDGEPTERAAATGSGTFDATYSSNDDGSGVSGSATATIDVAGHASFTGGPAWVGPADESTTVIVIESADGGRSLLALFVENASVAAGASISLGGTVAGAEIFEEDGTTIAFVDGTLTLDDAGLVDGAAFRGSFTVTGDAYVIPADQSGYEGGGPGEGEGEEDCTGLDTLASTFTPAQVYVQTAGPDDGFPAGYDRALTFTEASGNAMLGLIVASDVDLHTGAPYAFSSIDFEGRPYPAAMLALATCADMIYVDNGTLTATQDDATSTLSGTLEYSVAGADRSISFTASFLAE